MRIVSRALPAGGLGFAVSFLVACGGGSGLLSSNQANTLNSQLDQVSSAVASGDCTAASSAVNSFSSAIPGAINPTLRDNLSQDAARLGQLAARECHSASVSTATTTSTPTNTATKPATTTAPATTPPPSTPAPTLSTPATTPSTPGSTSSGASGGAGIGGGGGTGGAGAGSGSGNGNGNGKDNGNGKGNGNGK